TANIARQRPLSRRPRRLFQFHLSTAVGGAAGDTELFRQDPALSQPVIAQCRGVVADRAILQRDDGFGTNPGPVSVCAAGRADALFRDRYVRPRPAQSRAAGDDAVRVLAAA